MIIDIQHIAIGMIMIDDEDWKFNVVATSTYMQLD